MAQHPVLRKKDRCAFAALPEYISADAWTALRILGALAVKPSNIREICRHADLGTPDTSALLDLLVRRGFVHPTGRDGFALRLSAQAISIAAIVKAVDGDVLRRAHQEDVPELQEILRRMTSATADILDNYSLAEAVED